MAPEDKKKLSISQLMFSVPSQRQFEFPRVIQNRLGSVFLKSHIESIQVFEDRVEISKNKKKTIILFSDLSKIRFNRFGGTRFELCARDGRTYQFTTMLERSDYILDAAMLFNRNLMLPHDYSFLRERLLLEDHYYARKMELYFGKYRKYFLLRMLTLAFFVIGFYYLGFSARSRTSYFGGDRAFLAMLFFPVLLYLSISILVVFEKMTFKKMLRKQIAQNPQNKRRDTKLEEKVIKLYTFIVLSVVALFLFYIDFSSILLRGRVIVENDAPGLQIKKGIYTVDYNITCKKCPTALQRNKCVQYRDGFNQNRIGRVAAVEGEEMPSQLTDNEGKTLITTDKIVPQGMVALRVGSEGSAVGLFPLKQIVGILRAP